jgi:hypothetical protein
MGSQFIFLSSCAAAVAAMATILQIGQNQP